MLAAHTPLAEVLTVVRQKPISVLAYPGTRPADHLSGVEVRRRVRFDPHRVAAGESRHRDLFDWPPVQATRKSRVMHDPAITHVDPVMQIAAAGCNEVRAQRWLLALRRQLSQAGHCERPSGNYGAREPCRD